TKDKSSNTSLLHDARVWALPRVRSRRSQSQDLSPPGHRHSFLLNQKADAITLIFEFPWNAERLPATIFALTLVCGRANSGSGCNGSRECPNVYRGHNRVIRNVDHGDGVGCKIGDVSLGSVWRD